VAALEGESLEQLSERSGNSWDPLYTAVANGLFIDQRLRAGQRIKVAVPEPYRPTETASTATGAEP